MTSDDSAPLPAAHVSGRTSSAERLERYLSAEAAYLRQDDDDPEIVHDARVAARRLRAALDASTAPGEKAWRRDLRRAVKRSGSALGAVRDADVQLELLGQEREAGPAKEAPGIDRLVATLRRERVAANERALATLGDPGIRKPLAKAKRRLGGADHAGRNRSRPDGGGDASRRIADGIDALLARAGDIAEPGTPEAMHALRIAIKRLRYTIELDLGRLGEAGDEAVETLKAFQDALGALHDRDVLIDLTRHELRAVADEESARVLEGAAPPDRNADRVALLAFLARIAAARDERSAAFAARWEALLAEGFEGRLRALATGPGHGRGKKTLDARR